MSIEKDFTKELLVIAPMLDIVSIKEQNKAKAWNTRLLTLSVDNKGNFVHNANEIKSAVSRGMEVLKANIELTNSLDELEMYNDTLNTLFLWIQGTRKESTSNMDQLKKVLSEPEKLLSDMKPLLKEKIEKLNEEIFKIRRINIFNEFQTLEDESELNECDINFEVFNSFADEKKKTKTYDLNKSGNLSAAAKTAIKQQFDLVANPIIEARKLSKLKEKEQNLLTLQLSKIETSGTNEELQLSINELNSIEDTLDTYFPNIKDNAKSQILSLNKIIHNAIDQNDRISKENAQNEKDLNFISAVSVVDIDNTSDINSLTSLLADLENYEDLNNMLPKNKRTAKDLIIKLDTKIQTLKQNELKNIYVPIEKAAPVELKNDCKIDPIPKEVIEEHNDYFDDVVNHEIHPVGKETIEVKTELKQFKLSDKDIKFISEIKISAVDNLSAVGMLIEYISNHLDFCGLEEIK